MDPLDNHFNRLGTFNSCPEMGNHRPINLAKTGLHYDPNSKKVCCHVCGKDIDLSKDTRRHLPDVDVHRSISPNCPFVTGTYSRNIPVPEYSNQQRQRIKEWANNVNVCGRKHPVQVEDTNGTSCHAINNSSPIGHMVHDNDRSQLHDEQLATDLLLPSPTPTPSEIYKDIFDAQIISADGVFILETRDALLIS